jgi:hypothetical protein
VIVDIKLRDGDDPVFISSLSALIARLTSDHGPRELYLTRVAKWFDCKWLRFSGTGRVRFDGASDRNDVALDAVWQTHLTFPPFSPAQLSPPMVWHRAPHGGYDRVSKPRAFVEVGRRHSSANLQRRLRSFSDSAVFVWFSSFSDRNGVASVMSYSVQGAEEQSWYVSVRKQDVWRVDTTKGISRAQFLGWFPLP